MSIRIGSLFTGYGGLTMATETVFGGRTVWASDIDPGASKIIAHRYPHAPNLGDITKIDYAAVEPIDLLDAGWPCQPFSHAGKRLGAADERALWPEVARAVRALRPRHVVLENVAAIASAGELARATADLAALGYVGSWRCLRAADVGAPHGRARIFILATDATGSDRRRGGRGGPDLGGTAAERNGRAEPGDRSRAAADARSLGRNGGPGRIGAGWAASLRDEAINHPRHRDHAASDPGGEVVGLRPGLCEGEPEGQRRGRPDHDAAPDAADADQPGPQGPVSAVSEGRAGVAGCTPTDSERISEPGRGELRDLGGSPPSGADQGLQRQRDRDAADHRGAAAWGQYAPAIRRWERVLGRPAPAPTEDSPEWHMARQRRLSGQHKALVGFRGSLRRFLGPVPQRLTPLFVEWMMGLPAGWVTDVPGLTRNAQLKALGNGVVPQQAEAALRLMLSAVIAA